MPLPSCSWCFFVCITDPRAEAFEVIDLLQNSFFHVPFYLVSMDKCVDLHICVYIYDYVVLQSPSTRFSCRSSHSASSVSSIPSTHAARHGRQVSLTSSTVTPHSALPGTHSALPGTQRRQELWVFGA